MIVCQLYITNVICAIGQEGNLLIRLHPLGFQYFKQAMFSTAFVSPPSDSITTCTFLVMTQKGVFTVFQPNGKGPFIFLAKSCDYSWL
jgi:hypothetical protein